MKQTHTIRNLFISSLKTTVLRPQRLEKEKAAVFRLIARLGQHQSAKKD
ncbi:MAG: hypothetical protein L6420_08990 [Elusimicrobia bacterium]|nr:hypothetical protein [Elusimicrobiota bacterium]